MNDRRSDDKRIKEIRDMIKEDVKPDIKKLHDAYFGNGHKGLKTLVGQHAIWIKVLCGATAVIITYIGVGKLLAF